LIVYNYVESPTVPLSELVDAIKAHFGSRAPVFSIPLALLVPVAGITTALLGSKSPIHPARVRKAAMSTHIVPAWLQDARFPFRYSFDESLRHWSKLSPEDFR
jgi:hypothetical protein